VYLACRELRGEFKASLHESGEWHIGYSEAFYDDAFPESGARPESRFIEEWPRPQPIEPGVTLAFRVLTLWSSATDDRPLAPRVFTVPAPPHGEAVEVAVLITAPSFPTSTWPGHANMGTKPIGSFQLASGDTVWLVYRNHPFAVPPLPPARGTLFKGVDKSALDSPRLRAIVFGQETDGSRTVIDVPVRKGE
jgi:hypothetical protein